jgi:hypothetical protein
VTNGVVLVDDTSSAISLDSNSVSDSSLETTISETPSSAVEVANQSLHNSMRDIMLKAKAQAVQVVEASGID